jgi:heparanase 1
VDKDTLRPNPDFFAYLLFKRLMGPAVLDVPPPGTPDVKAFAHCTRVHGQYTAGSAEAADVQPGAVTLLLLNFSPNTTYSVAPALQGAAGAGATRHEYVLTADGTLEMFGGAVPRLNGQPLVLSDKGEYPALTPKRVGADQPITLPPTSIGFFVMTDVAAAACPRLQG